jgi:hypothetical protein
MEIVGQYQATSPRPGLLRLFGTLVHAINPPMDIDGDDSALGENSEFEEGSSYSMSVFSSFSRTQLDQMQAEAHPKGRKKVIMKPKTWNCQAPNFG